MKKLLCLPLFLLAATSYADQLQTFEQVKATALAGKNIHIAVDFSKCTPGMPGVHIGLFTPNEIQIDEANLYSSLMHFTLNNPQHRNTPVYEFVSYDIKNDDKVVVSFQTLDAVNYSPLSQAASVTCPMNSGATISS